MTAPYLSDAALDRLRRIAAEEVEVPLPTLIHGRYRLLEELARGGMGTVYRAEDRVLEREVAVKILSAGARGGAGGQPQLAERMLAEAKILARLEHPGIVPVHDVGSLPDGRVFYAMRLVRGQRLDHHVLEQHVAAGASRAERLRIFERLCEAVAFAHAHGVIHRDLKPENIMVGPFGEVLVLDWGVARLRGTSAPDPGPEPDSYPDSIPGTIPGPGSPTAHGTVLGTPGYMPPEQARGEVDRIDARADVYSLGAVLRFLLGSTGPPPRPLAAIAERALSAEPEDRYSSVEALARDIAHFRAGLAVSAYRESVLERGARFVRRYRTPILLLLAYLAMRVALYLWRGV